MVKTQVQKDDETFIKLFKKFDAKKSLNHSYTNKEITNTFPNFKINKGRNKILELIKWRVNNVDDNVEVIESIFELIDNVIPKFKYTNSTIDNHFTNYVRQPIMKHFGEDSHYYELVKQMVALPDDVKGEILKAASAKVEEKNKDRVVINLKEMLDIIRDNINSENVFRRAISLLLASGCRTIELFEQANFTRYKDLNNWVTQDFLAKKKGKIVEAIKPILFLTADQFITELKKVRTELKEKYKNATEPGELTKAINSQGNNVVKEIFKNREGFTLHFCRKIYGVISYKMYGSSPSIHGKNLDFHYWLSAVLGHTGQMAVSNYSHIVLDSDTLHSTEVPEKITELEVKVEELQERLDTLNIKNPIKELPREIAKDSKEKSQMKKIKIIYDNYKEEFGEFPTQTELEQQAKEIAPRRVIRLFFKWQKSVNIQF